MPDIGLTLLAAFGLVFVIEGLLYAVFPGPMKKGIAVVLGLSDPQIQKGGLIAIVLGVVLVWLAIG